MTRSRALRIPRGRNPGLERISREGDAAVNGVGHGSKRLFESIDQRPPFEPSVGADARQLLSSGCTDSLRSGGQRAGTARPSGEAAGVKALPGPFCSSIANLSRHRLGRRRSTTGVVPLAVGFGRGGRPVRRENWQLRMEREPTVGA